MTMTRRRGSIAALGAALALMLAVLGAGFAPAAGAQHEEPVAAAQLARGGASLTIHNRLCPEGYAGTNYFRDCHERSVGAGLEFSVRGQERMTRRTNVDGNVTFGLEPGRYLVRGGVPGEFAATRVFCAPAAEPGTRFPFRALPGVRGGADVGGIRIRLAPGDAVVCDWYNIPESQR